MPRIIKKSKRKPLNQSVLKNVEENCQVCLKSCSNCNDIHEEDDVSKAMKEIFDINMETPGKICPKCDKSLLNFYSFFVEIKKAHFDLQEIVDHKQKLLDLVDLPEIKDESSKEDDELIIPSPSSFVSDERSKGLKVEIIESKDRSDDIQQKEGVFKELEEIKTQKKTGRKGKNYVCDICQAIYTSYISIKKHILRVHAPPRTFECENCPNLFTAKYHLERHVREAHPKQKIVKKQINRDNICPYCGIVVVHLKKHIQKMHDNPQKDDEIKSKPGPKIFICNICGKKIQYYIHMKVHIEKKHLRIQKDQCEYCHKFFYDNATLKRHIRCVHLKTQIRKHEICPQCGITSQCLAKHMDKFHNEAQPQYVCHICGFIARTKHTLSHHKYKKHSSGLVPKDLELLADNVVQNLDLENVDLVKSTKDIHELITPIG